LTRHDAPLGSGWWSSAPVCSEAEADFSCLAKGCRDLYEELTVGWRVSGDNVPRREGRPSSVCLEGVTMAGSATTEGWPVLHA
jgi:hypothetical protein